MTDIKKLINKKTGRYDDDYVINNIHKAHRVFMENRDSIMINSQ
jgi:hypothetical protein